MSPSDGAVQKIITTGGCGDPATSTAISWNEVGPQGATGLPGPVGPAGKDAPVDQTVIALPPAPATKRRGQFVVTLLLPGPGTYLLEGSVAWDRLSLTDDAPTTCEMLRSVRASALDTVNLTISKAGPFAGFIQQSAVMTVAKPVPSNGPVQQVAVPVPVRFKCIASRSAKSKAPNTRVTFHDWSFTATPVKVSVIPKP